MTLPDPLRSNAVLIGTSEYAHGPFTDSPLPRVKDNLRGLTDVVTDRVYGGFRRDRCTVIDNDLASAATPNDIATALIEGAREATDTLLVYYAGHGMIEHGGLYLTLPQTQAELLDTSALAYDSIRKILLRNRSWQRLIVVLDCCYAGMALPEALAADDGLGLLAIEGTYLLTAAGPLETALATGPAGSPYTAFTGALLEQLTSGDPELPDTLILRQLFPRLRTAMEAMLTADRQRPPRPRQMNPLTAGDLALTRNRAPAGAQAMVLDVRERGVMAASRLRDRDSAPVPLPGFRPGISVPAALARAEGSPGRVVLVVPPEWDGPRRAATAELAAGPAVTTCVLSRPEAAAHYAQREWELDTPVGTALLVHEQSPLGACASVVSSEADGWHLLHTEKLSGERTHIEGFRLSSGVLTRSAAADRVVGLLLLTTGLSAERETELRAGLEFLEPPIYQIRNGWPALATGALFPAAPPAPEPPAARPPVVTLAPVPPKRVIRRPARPRLGPLDRISLAIATGFGGIGFALLHLALSVGTGPAAAVAGVSAVATYLGRTPVPPRAVTDRP